MRNRYESSTRPKGDVKKSAKIHSMKTKSVDADAAAAAAISSTTRPAPSTWGELLAVPRPGNDSMSWSNKPNPTAAIDAMARPTHTISTVATDNAGSFSTGLFARFGSTTPVNRGHCHALPAGVVARGSGLGEQLIGIDVGIVVDGDADLGRQREFIVADLER